jgi:acyl carrier protein
VVTEETKIDHRAIIGVSSLGFGGSNAHVIVKGVDASVRKEIRPLKIPFDRERALPLSHYIQVPEADAFGAAVQPEKQSGESGKAVTREDIDNLLSELFFQLTNIREIEPEIELTNQGLDSMSGTELISQLEASLKIEIGPEVLFEYPLRDQFVDQVYALAAGIPN